MGSGAFGVVYEASLESDPETRFAFKIGLKRPSGIWLENAPKHFGTLKHEVNVLRRLQHSDGFPRLYAWQTNRHPHYMVMELLGPTLESVIEDVGNGDSLVRIAANMVDILQELHSNGFVMNDIHFENVCLRRSRSNEIVMIDFGLSTPFRGARESDGGAYYTPDIFKYTPLRHDLKLVRGPRDDLERLIYKLVSVSGESLPWEGFDASVGREIKRTVRPEDVCSGKATWLLKALEYISTLGFYDEPDYEYIRKSLS